MKFSTSLWLLCLQQHAVHSFIVSQNNKNGGGAAVLHTSSSFGLSTKTRTSKIEQCKEEQQCGVNRNLVLLWAKKKKNTIASVELLDAMDELLDDEDENGGTAGMSLKEQKAAAKKAKKANKKKGGGKLKAAALEALEEIEQQEDELSQDDDDEQTPTLSKKQLKALKKKQKAAKNAQKEKEEEEDVVEVVVKEEKKKEPPKKLTLEEKIRKERPPPRVRIMEGVQPGFVSLRLEGVGITFRDQQVLKDVSWGVQTGDRIGLVGHNGAGKTTQLRILAGELEPTTGDVVKSSKDVKVAMLRQEFVDELIPTRKLKDEFMSVFQEELQILQDIRERESQLAALGDSPNVEEMQVILDSMQDLQTQAEVKNVYALESRVQKVMDLMGFTQDEGEDLVSSFSGGWKMRIGLGKVLLQDPNVLLLDEPTNHLDLDSVFWLEEFLRQQNIPMIVVSHDREFLDQVCTKIVDAEGGLCSEYNGNYSRFLKLKKAKMDAWRAAYKNQEKKVKEEQEWINKFKVKQPQAVKQRKEKLEKFKASADYVQRPPNDRSDFRFRFPDAPRISPEVAQVSGLTHSYNNGETENPLFENTDLFIEKGDRIAVVGPNGSGKSTLLRFVLGREQPNEGEATIVGQNVISSYFEQNQADALDLDKTVMQTVQEACTGDESYGEMRKLLAQFLFRGDDVEKKVRVLSGGEKARLSLCTMMLKPANFLVLDEPTNHLDIPAKEMMEEALQHFDGSVVVISHDRYFISRVATTIVAIEDKKLVKYLGDYKSYMERSQSLKDKAESRYVKGVDGIGSAVVVDLEALKKKNFGGSSNAHMVRRKNKGVKNAKRNSPR